MKASNVSDVLYKSLDFRAKRHSIIAGNIANINTPNYKEKDLVFEDFLKKESSTNDLKLKVTNKMHIDSFEDKKSNSYKVVQTGNIYEQNDQNNVNLDRQMSEMAKNSMMVEALTQAIKKDISWMKLVIDAAGKN